MALQRNQSNRLIGEKLSIQNFAHIYKENASKQEKVTLTLQ